MFRNQDRKRTVAKHCFADLWPLAGIVSIAAYLIVQFLGE